MATAPGNDKTSPDEAARRNERLAALLARGEELQTLQSRYGIRLLDNARAFAESAVGYAAKGSPREQLFMILHLASALELLLKAKLALWHQKYLVAGNTLVTERQFDEGDFKSVDVEECLKRLKRYCGFDLNDRQRHVIKALRNLRNRLAHYVDMKPDTPSQQAVAAAGLNLFIDLNNSELSDIEPYNGKTMSQLVEALVPWEGFVKARLASLEAGLRSSVRPVTRHLDECSVCLQDAATIDGDMIRCLFCGCESSVREVAVLFSEDRSVEGCPVCHRRSVSIYAPKHDEPTRECFCCGYFTGPELEWWDWRDRRPLPRLHDDRSCFLSRPR